MRALILLLSFSFCAFSQSDLITIEQTGYENQCIASNERSDGLNVSHIVQTGKYNGTVFDLTGDGISDPTMIVRTAPNCEAIIEETGNYNSALIQQNGDANTTGSIYQVGDFNMAILKQGYCTNGALQQEGTRNSIDAQQLCEEAILRCAQEGSSNMMTVEQKSYSELEATQNGKDNGVVVYVDLFSNGKSVQEGEGNYLDAMLFSEQNTLSAIQKGNDNYLKTYEDYYSKVDANQLGNGNEAVVTMDCNVIVLNQVGNNNYSEQTQWKESYGLMTTGTVNQHGNNNSAYQEQGSFCTGDIKQMSDDNYAYQVQHNPTGTDQNYAQIVQAGDTQNYAIQTQTGCGLSSVITQTGSNNRAESCQTSVDY